MDTVIDIDDQEANVDWTEMTVAHIIRTDQQKFAILWHSSTVRILFLKIIIPIIFTYIRTVNLRYVKIGDIFLSFRNTFVMKMLSVLLYLKLSSGKAELPCIFRPR